MHSLTNVEFLAERMHRLILQPYATSLRSWRPNDVVWAIPRTTWHCPFPDLPPIVGFAKTATIRARHPVSGSKYMEKRMDYLDYVAAAPSPSVVVIEDKDEPAGYGAFWGEVQTNVHKALGCLSAL